MEVYNTLPNTTVKDFDIMFNKNPFGIAIYGAAGAIELSGSQRASKFLPCSIDKKNLDQKNPPKHPFKVQVAAKTSLDIFYFEVPCMLHCLIDLQNPMKPEEFKKFWEMINKSNETTLNITNLHGSFTTLNGGDLASNIAEGLSKNGFASLARVPKKDVPNTTMLYFGAKTINNLPLLVEVAANQGNSSAAVVFRVPVLPLKPLLEETLEFILNGDTRKTA